MLDAAWRMGQVRSRRVGAWDRASMESARQSTLPWTAAHTVHETIFVCILAAAVVNHDSSLDNYGGRRTTRAGATSGAALGGVADQGEGAALAPRGTACSETPSSGEGLPEDPVTGFVRKRALRTQLKCLPARGCGTR